MFKLILAAGALSLLAACSSLSGTGYGSSTSGTSGSSIPVGGPRGSSGGGPN